MPFFPLVKSLPTQQLSRHLREPFAISIMFRNPYTNSLFALLFAVPLVFRKSKPKRAKKPVGKDMGMLPKSLYKSTLISSVTANRI
jgi:hypothetical protein